MWRLLFFAVGVFAVAVFIPQLSYLLLILFIICSCILALLLCFVIKPLCKKVINLLLSVSLGLSIGCWLGLSLLKGQLPAHLEKQTLLVTGIVESIPIKDRKKQRFIFRLKTVEYEQLVIDILNDKKVLLSWYFPRESGSEIPIVKAGDTWQFAIRLRRPRGFVNPGGFDYQAYLLRKKIMATGYVLSSKSYQYLEHHCSINCWRQSIQTSLMGLAKFKGKGKGGEAFQHLPLLIALAIGNTQFMKPEDWQLLRDTGTIHLFAISGLHIGLAAAIGFLVGQFFLRLAVLCFPYCTTLYVIPAVLSITFALLYALLAGMSLPTQRALIMVLAFYGGQLFFKQFPVGFTLALALAVIAVLDPLAVTSQGFWLSFIAVAILLYGFSARPKKTGIKVYIFQLVYAQWLLFIALLLPVWLNLQGISLTAPIANLFAVLWVSLLIVPIIFLLFACLGVSYFVDIQIVLTSLLWLLDKLFSILWGALDQLNESTIGFWYFPFSQPDSWMIPLVVVGSLWLLAPQGIRYRYLALCCFLPLFFPIKEQNSVELTFMDVGQGTALVIKTPNYLWIYDTGPYYSDRFNAGEHIIVPYLRSQGISQIDYLMVSHSDGDHSGGVSGVLRSAEVNEILVGQPLTLSSTQALSMTLCHQGQSWQMDHITFQVLWPPSQQSDRLVDMNDNNHSCVLLIEIGDHRVLLAGDIEKSVEERLLELHDLSKNIDILLVPHHGSKTSSSLSWVEQLSPLWAVVTAGFNNRHGHPHLSVLKRYQSVNSIVLNTAKDGAIVFRLPSVDDDWQVTTWRSAKRRYWYD